MPPHARRAHLAPSPRDGAGGRAAAGSTFETVKVADGIYALISPAASSGVVTGNSVAIVRDDKFLVVDSGHFPSLARRMIAEKGAFSEEGTERPK